MNQAVITTRVQIPIFGGEGALKRKLIYKLDLRQSSSKVSCRPNPPFIWLALVGTSMYVTQDCLVQSG